MYSAMYIAAIGNNSFFTHRCKPVAGISSEPLGHVAVVATASPARCCNSPNSNCSAQLRSAELLAGRLFALEVLQEAVHRLGGEASLAQVGDVETAIVRNVEHQQLRLRALGLHARELADLGSDAVVAGGEEEEDAVLFAPLLCSLLVLLSNRLEYLHRLPLRIVVAALEERDQAGLLIESFGPVSEIRQRGWDPREVDSLLVARHCASCVGIDHLQVFVKDDEHGNARRTQ